VIDGTHAYRWVIDGIVPRRLDMLSGHRDGLMTCRCGASAVVIHVSRWEVLAVCSDLECGYGLAPHCGYGIEPCPGCDTDNVVKLPRWGVVAAWARGTVARLMCAALGHVWRRGCEKAPGPYQVCDRCGRVVHAWPGSWEAL
jgi:hypothetical protein